jgi:hypothetical protein
MNRPFIVYALPRSRTYWLKHLLSYGDWECAHDHVRYLRSLDDIKSWFKQDCVGSVETAAAPFWRLVPSDVRTVVVRRPVHDVVQSLASVGRDPVVMLPLMTKLDRKLDQIEARVPGVLSVRYDDLAREDVCAAVFEHCLPYYHDPDWWAKTARQNLQINFDAMVRYFDAHRPQIEKIAKVAKQATISRMTRPTEVEGVTFQEESFETAYPDALRLFREHAVAAGESPDLHEGANIELFKKMDSLGMLQILTARSNGRMFGYLLTIIAPSLEVAGVTTGTHTLFYGSPDIPFIGMMMQREAITRLKARGVSEVLMRAGIRAAAGRVSALYRRLGAEEFGQLYRLNLEEAA